MIADRFINYGIQNEKSDIRAHVSVVNRGVFVFQTSAGVEAIEKYKPRAVWAGQPGVVGYTARGWLVKPEWVRGIKFISPQNILWDKFREDLNTSEKGKYAVEIVCHMMRSNIFPLYLDANEAANAELQISGTDIVVCCNKRIQVKCDYRCGPKPGTGNLFFQMSECNPLRRI